MEIYNEQLNDLLDPNIVRNAGQDRINIREEKNGQIALYGLREEKVDTAEALAALLDKGSNARTTAAT